MKNLIDLYKSFQASVGMVSDDDGYVSSVTPGSDVSKPYFIDGKRLVNPTKTQLSEPDWSNRIGFHPLLQKVEEGESRAVDKYRDRMNAYSDFMFGMLLLNIAKLAVEKEKHISLSPTQAAYLGPFSDSDIKFEKFLTSLVSSGRTAKKNFEFVRFSLIKGRQYQGKRRTRVAVIHFPLYEALPKDGKGTTILGHKLRGIDVKMIRAMYEYLFPNIGDREQWEVPSDSLIAASMESLMTLYGKFIDCHNSAVVNLGEQIEAGEMLLIVNDWRNEITAISDYLPEIRKIPWLEGASPAKEVAAGPKDISMTSTPVYQAAPTVNHNATPVLPATFMINQPPAQEAQQTAPAPRIKLGIAPATHQDNSVGKQLGPQPIITAYQHRGPTVGQTYHEPQQQQQQVAQQQQQYLAPAPVLAPVAPAAPQAMRLPDTARVINGQVYIPIESNGVSAVPAGGILVDGKIYVPILGAGAAPAPGIIGGVGMPAPIMGGGIGQAPGIMGHQQITDPAQVPNLTPAEVQYYRMNPAMFHNYLAELNNGAAFQMQQASAARANAVPAYLQRILDETQRQQANNPVRGIFG